MTLKLIIQKKQTASSVFLLLINLSPRESMHSRKQLGRVGAGERPLQLVIRFSPNCATPGPWCTARLMKTEIRNPRSSFGGAADRLISFTHSSPNQTEVGESADKPSSPSASPPPRPRYQLALGKSTLSCSTSRDVAYQQ